MITITSSSELSHKKWVQILPSPVAPLLADGVVDHEEEEGAEGEEDEDEPEPELKGLESASPQVAAVLATALPES